MLFGIGFGFSCVRSFRRYLRDRTPFYCLCVPCVHTVRMYVRILPVGMKANIVFSFRPHQQRWLARRLYLRLTAPGSLLCVRRLTTSGCTLTSVLFYPFILLIILRVPLEPHVRCHKFCICVCLEVFFFYYLCTFFCTSSSSIKHLADV